MNAFAVVIFLSYLFYDVCGIRCIESIGDSILGIYKCPPSDTYCGVKILSLNGNRVIDRRQGCQSKFSWKTGNTTEHCDEKGFISVNKNGWTGAVYCCDTSLCNTFDVINPTTTTSTSILTSTTTTTPVTSTTSTTPVTSITPDSNSTDPDITSTVSSTSPLNFFVKTIVFVFMIVYSFMLA